MARSSLLILAGCGLTPALAACAMGGAGAGGGLAPTPMRLALGEAPPMPQELLAPTNGKADAPFQVDGRIAMAILAKRPTPPAASPPAPVQVAAVSVARPPTDTRPTAQPAAPSKVALILAKAASPTRPAPGALLGAKGRGAAAALEPPVRETVAFSPAAPLSYVELTRADIVMNSATPLVRPAAVVRVGAAPKRPVHVVAATTPRVAPTLAHIETIAGTAPPSPPPARTAPREVRRDLPVITRIDAMIRRWFANVRA